MDPLNKYLGRRGEIFLTGLCLTATPIGSGFAKSWQGLFAARFIMGIGIGAKNATVPIYSAEMAPARIRGALVMFWQLWVVAGMSPFRSLRALVLICIPRYFPRLLCQCHRQRYWCHRMATSTWFRLHPLLHPRRWYLVLSRVASMAHEEGQPCQSFPLYESLACPSHHRCTRLLLLLCDFRGGKGRSRRFWLLHTTLGLLFRS